MWVALQANLLLYVMFVVTLAAGLAVIPFKEDIFLLLNIEPPGLLLQILILMPVIILFGIVSWIVAGYKVVDKQR